MKVLDGFEFCGYDIHEDLGTSMLHGCCIDFDFVDITWLTKFGVVNSYANARKLIESNYELFYYDPSETESEFPKQIIAIWRMIK